jgi:hypothetical protein
MQNKTGEDVSYYTKREECLELEVNLLVRPDGWAEVWDNFANASQGVYDYESKDCYRPGRFSQ